MSEKSTDSPHDEDGEEDREHGEHTELGEAPASGGHGGCSGEADGGDTDLPILGMGTQASSRYWEKRIINTIVLEGGIRLGEIIYGDWDTDGHPVIGL